MRQGSIRETLALEIKVPRGFAGYWQIIREFDQQGPWTIREISDRSNVKKKEVYDFVWRLRKGGYVKVVGEALQPGSSANLYRLLKSPRRYPRLRRDGTELPEPVNERLWRTIKMVKQFTVSELAELASDELLTVKKSTVQKYLQHLNRSNILHVVVEGGSKKEARYMLANNLGAEAPKILRCHSVYDPNSNQILGSADVKEASL